MLDFADVQLIRQQMPAVTAHIYFNAGTFGPMPGAVPQAMQERLRVEYTEGRLGMAFFETMGRIFTDARARVARLLHASPDEIALTSNTGEGMNIVSYGFNWREGDEVITTNHEHMNALGPLYQLRDRYGVVIRFADIGQLAQAPVLPAIANLATPRTRLVSLSHVTWTTGALLDIRAVGDWGGERGIPILVDGAQSAGAIPLDMQALNIDFYAIPMQKWLCGPDGAGALYIRKASFHYITPTYVGIMSSRHEKGVEWELVDRAQRFETGGRPMAVVVGQVAALQWLEETIGFENIYARVSALHRYACSALASVPGVTLLVPEPGASGLVAFTLAGQDADAIVTYLREQHNIIVRSIPSMKSVRISTGFYNTEEDIDALVQALHLLS